MVSRTRRFALSKSQIVSPAAPPPIGPYSQAVAAGSLVFLSGQVPLDPKTGKVVDGGVEAQTRQVLDNLSAVLEAAGLGFDSVVKTTIFLADMADFKSVNAVYAGSFGECPPARSTVQVAGLPLGVRVEIDAVAAR
jgi:2-iminobutanoate/2-iminopropanoate deaminase